MIYELWINGKMEASCRTLAELFIINRWQEWMLSSDEVQIHRIDSQGHTTVLA